VAFNVVDILNVVFVTVDILNII